MNQRIQEDTEYTPPELISVLHSWLERCRDARDGHYKRAEKLFELSQMMGYVLIYSTVFVTVFSFADHDATNTIFGINKQHVVVLFGCIAAVISGIVTQSRFGERAEMHRSSAARYANLSRDIEELKMNINAGLIVDDALSIQTRLIIKEWNNLSEVSLLTPNNKTHTKQTYHILIAISFITIFFFVAI
ncbi:SLATT domain-containing protein [Shewanella nanhaiensis]|uniref:SLATT domain-containing protein n=1 Tax=Shewanella nanhaiensis TaxID=2864872 RepID=A0ABS7E956_9GAMM|nr:SLATT domain-containing protein [Shewanella nanhaiensis]MBW8186201.1 SLATT domain-containing protein [Shewanella nanhaiensis]